MFLSIRDQMEKFLGFLRDLIEYFHDFIQNSAGRTFFYTLDIFGLVIHSKTQTAFFHVFSLNSRSGSRKMHVLLRKRISS